MLNLEDLKNRLMQFVSSTVNLFIRDRAVDQPRFTYVTRLTKKSGPDPEAFGMVYRDEESGKEYLVDDLYAEPRHGSPFYAVNSIKEIKSRPTDKRHFDEENFKTAVSLERADIDVQEDMISFFEAKSKELGRNFEDRRPSGTKDLGKNRRTNPAYRLA